jgi:hypothetical protein
VDKKISGNHGRRRFQELRQRMQTEDEDIGLNNTSPPDSQTSSVEGVFAVPSKTSHPFRIIEHDAVSLQSMTSLGRVGRILGGSMDNTGEVLIIFFNCSVLHECSTVICARQLLCII